MRIILVHGAWMDARVWGRVIPLLTAKGHAATAVNLPGHGADATPASELSLDGYVAAAVSAIGKDKIVLVGHSMAGMVISAVAEKIPIQIERLVYVAAYLPRNGESLYQISQEDSDSHIGKFWRQEDPAHYSPAWIAEVVFASKAGFGIPKILLVEDDIDVTNIAELTWAFASRSHPSHSEVYFRGEAQNILPVFLDQAEKFSFKATKIIHNALLADRFPAHERPRRSDLQNGWPAETGDRVRKRWAEYGYKEVS